MDIRGYGPVKMEAVAKVQKETEDIAPSPEVVDIGKARGLTGFFKSGEGGCQIGAENVGEISAFLDEHGRKPEPRDGRADAPESGGGHGETRERIMLRRIETERHDQRAGRKSMDGLFRDAERRDVAVIPGADRQRNIEIGAEAGARAALVRITPDERVVGAWIGVDRNRKHVGLFVEDALRAVAVVDIDIEDATRSCRWRRCAAAIALLLKKQKPPAISR